MICVFLFPTFFLLFFAVQSVALEVASPELPTAESSVEQLYPKSLIEIAPRYRYALIAELQVGKLHLYERGVEGLPVLVKTMEMSIGKEGYGKQVEGDNKTPVGVYRITSHLTDAQLDDYYGNAAYPVNYPNAWDRVNQRTGYGIWLHAEPRGLKEKTRPLLDSNGCVVVSNNAIDELSNYLDIGYTYVLMTSSLEMVSSEQINEIKSSVFQQLNNWKAAWESRQSEPYLKFYSQKFNNLEKNKRQWDQYKKRVNGSKRFIDVNYSDVGIYAYPGEDSLYWVEFYQSYRSDNYFSEGWKRQLWQKESDNQWRIIYEGGG